MGGVSYLVVCYPGRSVRRQRGREIRSGRREDRGEWNDGAPLASLLQTADKTDSRAMASPTASILTLGVSATAPSKFCASFIQNRHSRSLLLLSSLC